MSNLQATMRSQARLSASARECVTRINTLLFHSTAPENFATGFYAILDPRTRRLECCNAGHNYPLLARPDGSHAWLSAGGLILGFLETYPYADETVQFQPGDTLLIFSDGLSEAANAAGEEFGESRLEELVKEHWVRPAVELVDALLAAVTAHQSGTPQTDDVTIVVIKAIE
jgi:sigma-B regulation protein RsbU (phosphoserine phosphatase)